jgi:MFS family permease
MRAMDAASGEGSEPALAVFRTAPFRWFLASRFFSGTATTLLRAAIAWHVNHLAPEGEAAFYLGLLGLVQFLPVLPLSLVAGAVADAVDRRRLIQIAQAVPLLCSLWLLHATLAGTVGLTLLFSLVAVSAVAWVFESPARASILPAIVPRALFPRAVTVMSTAIWLAFSTGPLLMGFAVHRAGLAAPYALHGALVFLSLVSLVRLPALPASSGARITWQAIREGMVFVWRNPVVLGCMTLDMFAVILGGATALLPIYASDILRVGAQGYGLLSGSLELGALAMSALLVFLPTIRRAGPALLVAVSLYGIATIGFGLSTWFPLSVAIYMAVGMADAVSVVLRGTVIQLATPDELRGRVSSLNFIFIGASNQLGAAESGFLASLTSPQFAVVFGGLGCLAVVGLVAWRLPELRRYRIGH